MRNRLDWFLKKQEKKKTSETKRLTGELTKTKKQIADWAAYNSELKRSQTFQSAKLEAKMMLAGEEAKYFETQWKLIQQKHKGKTITKRVQKLLTTAEKNYAEASERYQTLKFALEHSGERQRSKKSMQEYIGGLRRGVEEAQKLEEVASKELNKIKRGSQQHKYYSASIKLLSTQTATLEAKFKYLEAQKQRALQQGDTLKAREIYDQVISTRIKFNQLTRQIEKIQNLLAKELTK